MGNLIRLFGVVALLSTVVSGALMRRDCAFTISAQSGDTCGSLATSFGISVNEFISYNTGVDCTLPLTANKEYCILWSGEAPPMPSSSSTATTASSQSSSPTAAPTGPAPPSPTQAGLDSQCQRFHLATDGDTCQGIIDKYRTFSLQQFYAWNPAVGTSCSGLWLGYYYCIGTASTPTSPPSTTTVAPTPTPSNGFPSPVQPNIISTCKRFYQVQSGDFCQKIVDQYRTFTLSDFYNWNPSVGNTCASLQAGYFVCVGVDGTPTSPSPTSNPIPSPTQTGIIKTCTKYDRTNPGAFCEAFSNRIGISLPQLYAWNSILGTRGENCARNFLPETYYCTGVSGPLPAPGPTQGGIVDICTGYVMANPGGSCPVFANRVGISLQQLYAWNPVLGRNGENCQTSFWANTWYCTSVAG
ncbi:hypothetical protein BDZ85DRAFT_246993 [Elsinoe ampelina]|uniref:LysM domain-containing protein n=1 Tax=Elsinoe ampelina TaxID=302913 RepID=A0A6A6GLL7_9PEZI|nr:hypothetical protein BDZ85DRAFT_246993 [Elsinoe ampelina]